MRQALRLRPRRSGASENCTEPVWASRSIFVIACSDRPRRSFAVCSDLELKTNPNAAAIDGAPGAAVFAHTPIEERFIWHRQADQPTRNANEKLLTETKRSDN